MVQHDTDAKSLGAAWLTPLTSLMGDFVQLLFLLSNADGSFLVAFYESPWQEKSKFLGCTAWLHRSQLFSVTLLLLLVAIVA